MLGGVGEVGEDVGVDVDGAPDEREKGGSKDDAARRPTISFSGRIIECSADGILEVLELVATEMASEEHYEQPFLDDCEHPARSLVICGVHQRVSCSACRHGPVLWGSFVRCRQCSQP